MNFESKRNKLKSCLQEEKHVSLITLALEQCASTRSISKVLTEDAPPCVLHMSMHALEKFVKFLLQEALNHNVESNTRDTFVSAIEKCVNNDVLGSIEGRVRHWLFPISIEDPNAIGNFNFKRKPND